MVAVMIIPTGLGCAIGGHAGDATPAARLLAQACDQLIVHPNVVNASDICELTPNMLYVEGSILDRFLEGKASLRRIVRNRVVVVVNPPVSALTINAVNAARVTLGAEIDIVELKEPLVMVGSFSEDGRAVGEVSGWESLVAVVRSGECGRVDALAIHTPIDVPRKVAIDYFRDGGANGSVNPWGGVEAIASRLIADRLDIPVAHAPLESVDPSDDDLYFIGQKEEVNPRMAPEVVSTGYLHCVLKGLHTAPRVQQDHRGPGEGVYYNQISAMVSPIGCNGRPHWACRRAGIPVVYVRENTTCLNVGPEPGDIVVENYPEAAGVLLAMKAGLHLPSVRADIGKDGEL